MHNEMKRREFMQLTIAGTAMGLGGTCAAAWAADPGVPGLVSPGCRGSKVKVARLLVGTPGGHWPRPDLDIEEEARSYRAAMEKMKPELADVEFPVDELITSAGQAKQLAGRLSGVDGILVIHLKMGISAMLAEILAAGRPTVVFAAPYSGHEWAGFGALMNDPRGARLECILSSDRQQLAAAIRPFRAMHHLREAKILDCTTRLPAEYAAQVKAKFGTEIRQISLQRVVEAYNAVSDQDAQAETDHWVREAAQIVEPTKPEIFRACKLF